MGNLINRNDLSKHRAFIENYYERTHELRAAGNLDSVVGTPFLYRPDGVDLGDSSRQYLVWNMRRSPPVVTFELGTCVHTLEAQLDPRDLPCEFPDLGDSVLLDISVDEFFAKVLNELEQAWQSELNRANHKTPSDMFTVALDNMCRGDIPWDIRKADATLRKERLWDKYDLPGNPWVSIGGRSMLVKTQRLQVQARVTLRDEARLDTPLFEGDPVGPGAVVTGVFRVDD